MGNGGVALYIICMCVGVQYTKQWLIGAYLGSFLVGWRCRVRENVRHRRVLCADVVTTTTMTVIRVCQTGERGIKKNNRRYDVSAGCVKGCWEKKIVFVLSRVFCLFGRARSSGALPPLFLVNLFCTRCHVTKLHRTFCPITENCYGPLTVDILALRWFRSTIHRPTSLPL